MRCCHRTNRFFRGCCYLLLGVLLLPLVLVGTALAAPPTEQYRRVLTRESRAVWGLNVSVALFVAQIHQESQWNMRAVSPVGA